VRRELLLLLLLGCEREARRFEDDAPTTRTASASPYDDNAWAIGEGARLYRQMNCAGCHFHGGGGMGPALMDGLWIYGVDGAAIYTSIMNGRPNGMPSFRARLTDAQAWQLVAYVRSLSMQVPRSSAPGRDDHMSVTEPPARMPRLTPRQAP
jgi:cytochrome c oxidase cbb3-type subunit III